MENENLKNVQEPKKKNPKKIALIVVAIIAILLSGLQVFASVNGYGNVFFMIKNLVTTGTFSGEKEIFSDKEITISYKPIEISNDTTIQVNRLEIKEGKSNLYLTVKSQTGADLPLNYIATSKSMRKEYGSTGNNMVDTPPYTFEDVVTLKEEVAEDDTIYLAIHNSKDEELRILEINLKTKEITVKSGATMENNKISKVELRKYLDAFSLLNDPSNYTESDNLIEISAKIQTITEGKILAKRETINEIVKEFYGEKAKFETVKDANGKDVEVLKDMRVGTYEKETDEYDLMEHDRLGKCLKIESASYENGVYTIKYIYTLAEEFDEDKDNIEDLAQYETTIKLKRVESQKYSKYQVVGFDESVEVKSKVSTTITEENNDEQVIFDDEGNYVSDNNENNNLDNETKIDEASIKLKESGAWFDIMVLKDNAVKIKFTNKDIKLFVNGDYYYNKTFDIDGVYPKIKKVFLANNGSGVDPMAFFICEDGNVRYVMPFDQMALSDEKTETFKVGDKDVIELEDNIIDLKLKSANSDVIVASTDKGREVDIWNKWMEEDAGNTVNTKMEEKGEYYNILIDDQDNIKIVFKDISQYIEKAPNITTNNEGYNVDGIYRSVKKIVNANDGTGVNPITFFILDDGNVAYIKPFEQIKNNNNKIPDEFTYDRSNDIELENNIIDLKIKDNDKKTVIAITDKGEEIAIWNK